MAMRIPEKPPKFDLFDHDENGSRVLLKLMAPSVQELVREINEKYLHWDKVRFTRSLPEGVAAKELWGAVTMARQAVRQPLPLPLTFTNGGKQLSFVTPPKHLEWLHDIDKQGGGAIGTSALSALGDQSDRYMFSALMEEAIASSQLEGASTTRKVAKEMLRTKRKPRTDAERMILNNYNAILEVRDLKQEPLTPDMLCHLQSVLTEDTLNPEAVGRFRRDDEVIHVVDHVTNEVLHTPPPASELSWRVKEICDFANTHTEPFVHPIVKAAVLHFAIGFLHPFVDGNGRTARAIFYWYMLKRDYWLFEYFPISRVLVRAPAKYGLAYQYTETDGGDMTYFIRYHILAVREAMRDFYAYVANETEEAQKAVQLLELFPGLNYRQRATISDVLKNPGLTCTFASHQGKYHITYPTSRNDLLGLERIGLLRVEKIGKSQVFFPVSNIRELLQLPPAPKQAPHE
jgi:Fic family protein